MTDVDQKEVVVWTMTEHGKHLAKEYVTRCKKQRLDWDMGPKCTRDEFLKKCPSYKPICTKTDFDNITDRSQIPQELIKNKIKTMINDIEQYGILTNVNNAIEDELKIVEVLMNIYRILIDNMNDDSINEACISEIDEIITNEITSMCDSINKASDDYSKELFNIFIELSEIIQMKNIDDMWTKIRLSVEKGLNYLRKMPKVIMALSEERTKLATILRIRTIINKTNRSLEDLILIKQIIKDSKDKSCLLLEIDTLLQTEIISKIEKKTKFKSKNKGKLKKKTKNLNIVDKIKQQWVFQQITEIIEKGQNMSIVLLVIDHVIDGWFKKKMESSVINIEDIISKIFCEKCPMIMSCDKVKSLTLETIKK